ncbi:mitochondrial 37S ribosomal protein [Saccharomycopsis crataegensis]|uniref:Mitochondrial 37S ribosomal protein n=1 Tax=Saccharomycopsis crataegensis TaxID=43959 RepID=A0AAV5QF68_9ASCO|nr:mitochondrial 37S ribosomal protein [Saccharomycopsis crataegensis]
MSLVNLANVCAHLKNCTMVKHGVAKIPLSRLHLNLSFHLYKQGFISAIQKGSDISPDDPNSPVDITPDNISSRKLWLSLKYRDNQPVLSHISLVSKPNLKIKLSPTEIKALASGLYVRKIKPLQPAETILVKADDNEILDLQQVAAKNLGGMPLCRFR